MKTPVPLPGRAFFPWCHPAEGLPRKQKRAGDGALRESQPHSFAGTAPTERAAVPIPSARITVASPARTTARPALRPGRGSAGDSQAHSASALVSGSQPVTRLSGTPLRCLLFLIFVFRGIGCWHAYTTQQRICQASFSAFYEPCCPVLPTRMSPRRIRSRAASKPGSKNIRPSDDLTEPLPCDKNLFVACIRAVSLSQSGGPFVPRIAHRDR